MFEKAAIYCRLSKEDRDKFQKEDDSESIQNQKLLLTEYAYKHGYTITDYYCDDDYSGLDSERPEFNRLIKDAKTNKFSVILCKNQSRFTRDMELVERYIHGLFPLLGIRFVGIVDHVDSNDKGNKKSRQINGLINEWYCEDISDNVRSVLRAKMKDGQFIGSFAPYGYRKNPSNKNEILIDPEAAVVVKDIFSMFINGKSIRQICVILYGKGILTPSEYRKGVKELEGNKLKIWRKNTVRKILLNQTYIGSLVQGKTYKESYKSKKQIVKPESEWIIIKNNHESIIDESTFYIVENLIRENKRRYARENSHNKNREIFILASKVRCRDCGFTMTKVNTQKSYQYLYCQNYTRNKVCSKHSIRVDRLLSVLEEEICKITTLENGLSHLIVNSLIDYIEIGEKETDKKQEIIIHWRT
ncbi:MAG: recombinase family protein [Clostridiales bacterium]|nr:recombinase family protein [Clostridiales bacterium]